jgi:hypothetical protein
MLKEHAPVWVWDGYWWPAYVVLPALDLDRDLMLVRFENGVTAPVKAAEVRYRELLNHDEPSRGRSPAPEPSRRPGRPASLNVLGSPTSVRLKSEPRFV